MKTQEIEVKTQEAEIETQETKIQTQETWTPQYCVHCGAETSAWVNFVGPVCWGCDLIENY